MLPELATYFAAEGCGVVGTDLFLGKMPDAPVLCAALYEAPGAPPALDHQGLAFEKARLLIFVRGSSYAEARERVERFYRACLAVKNVALSSAVYLSATPVAPPYLAERDKHRRPVLGLEVAIWKQLTPLA